MDNLWVHGVGIVPLTLPKMIQDNNAQHCSKSQVPSWLNRSTSPNWRRRMQVA